MTPADLNAAQEKIARWILSTTQGHLYLNSPERYLGGGVRATPHAGRQRSGAWSWRARRGGTAGPPRVGASPDQPAPAGPHRRMGRLPFAHDRRDGRRGQRSAGGCSPVGGSSHLPSALLPCSSGDRERAVEAMERAVEMQGADFPMHARLLGVALALTESTRRRDRRDRRGGAPQSGRSPAVRLGALSRDGAFRRRPLPGGSRRVRSSRSPSTPMTITNARAGAYQMLAASLAQLGELKEARSALEQAVRLRPL